MQNHNSADLQLFAAELAAGAETASGAEAADAGQQTIPQTAPQTAQPQTEGDSPARRSWAEIRAEYRDDFDAEVQSIVQRRLRGAQEKLRRYVEREQSERLAGADHSGV